MEPMKKYYNSISLLNGTQFDEAKRISALEEIEWQLTHEGNREKTNLKKTETSIFSNINNVESLFLSLLNNLKKYDETTNNFLRVLCLACKHLHKRLKTEFLLKIGVSCIRIAEKACSERNWSVLENCFKCLKIFENKDWSSLLSNEIQRDHVLKIFHTSISLAKERSCEKTNTEFAAFKILCVEVFNTLIKIHTFKNEDNIKPHEWFMLLFPLLFDDNVEMRKVAYRTFDILKNQCPDTSCKLLYAFPKLREQLKMLYSKSLVYFARANEPDWLDLWCLMLELLGPEFSSKKNTELINYLLEVEETAFRSPNMNTRYNAFVGWKYLVNKFLDTSLEDASRRLKLLMQPLIANNSKTMEISVIKFEVWWQLIVGIEPCIERHATNILYNFLNFCFGPVSVISSVNNVWGNGDIPACALLANRRTPTSSPSNYPLVTLRRMKGLDVNRSDALAQILNTDSNKTEYKLHSFQGAIISNRTFLSLSKMIIHCVGECTILIVESKEMTAQERKFYLREIWRSLLLHIKRVDDIFKNSSSANSGQDIPERNEKTEMMKNIFRILLRLNEMASGNQLLANVCLSPVLEIVLSTENGLSDEVLSSRNYYIGTDDLLMGTPLLIMLDIFLSPACLSIHPHLNDDHKHQSDVLYMVLLQRVLHLGIGPSEITILFTQAVMKRIDGVVSNASVEGSKVKSIWIMVARFLTSGYVGLGRDINQGSEVKSDFSWLMSVLMFPVNNSQVFLTDQDMILRIWGQLFQAFQHNVFSSVCSVIGNEICNTLCGKMQQEICRKKVIKSEELLLITYLVTCAIEQIPFHSVNQVISGMSSESEKLSHVQNCFKVLQTLSTEIQKLKEENDVYINIVTQYTKCYQVFCDNLRGCPIQFLSLFFLEQIQYILSINVKKVGSSSNNFSTVCLRTWNSFLNIFLSGILRIGSNINKVKIVKMVHPVLTSSFNHCEHSVHEVTINFGVSENIILKIDSDCSKCRIIQEKRKRGKSSMYLNNTLSDDKSNSKIQDVLDRPLTHHQREVFRQRRDDIPALYQDLTQDSQPSFIDTSQNTSHIPATSSNKEHAPAPSSGMECKSSLSNDSPFKSKKNSSPISKELKLVPTSSVVEFKSPFSVKNSPFDSKGNAMPFVKECVPISIISTKDSLFHSKKIIAVPEEHIPVPISSGTELKSSPVKDASFHSKENATPHGKEFTPVAKSFGVEIKSPSSKKESPFHMKENSTLFSEEQIPVLPIEENSSFEAGLKTLPVEETSNSDVEAKNIKDSTLVKMYKTKQKNRTVVISHSRTPDISIIKSSGAQMAQQIQNEKETEGAHQKTILVIKRTTNNVLNSSTTNAPLSAIKESNLESNVTSLNQGISPKVVDVSCNSSSSENQTIKEMPIRMCISKLKTGTPEVKSIITNVSSSVTERNNVQGKEQSHITNSVDLLKEKKDETNVVLKCKDNSGTSEKSNSELVGKGSIKPFEENSVNDEIVKSLCEHDVNEKQCRVSASKNEKSQDVLNDQMEGHQKQSPKSPKAVSDVKSQKERCNSDKCGLIKEVQSDIKDVTSHGNLVVSPARVVLKRLEVEQVRTSTCRSLLFEEQETPKKNEKLLTLSSAKSDAEHFCDDLNSAKLESQVSNSKSTGIHQEQQQRQQQQQESDIESAKETNLSEIHPVEQLQTQRPSPKETIRSTKSDSQTRDFELENRDVYNTRSKTPAIIQNHKTRSKQLSIYRFTRNYEKKTSSKTQQKSNLPKTSSSKEKVVGVRDSTKQEEVETTKTVDHEHQNFPKTDQNSQATSSSPNVPESDIGLDKVTSVTSSAEHKPEGSECRVNVQREESIELKVSDGEICSKSPEVDQCATLDAEKNLPISDKSDFKNRNGLENVIEITDISEQKKPETEEIHLSKSLEKLNHDQIKSSPIKTQVSRTCAEIPGTGSSEFTKENEKVLEVGNPALSKEQINETQLKCIDTDRIKDSNFSPAKVTSDLERKALTTVVAECEFEQGVLRDRILDCSVDSPKKKVENVEKSCQKISISPNSSVSSKTDTFLQGGLGASSYVNNVKDISRENYFINEECTSQIPCNKGEYVRLLSLMPQSANTLNCPKTHRISTRSDWARRFGSKSDAETSRNIDMVLEKYSHVSDNNENSELDSSGDMIGSVDSLDEQDIIESSQDPKEMIPKPKLREVSVLVSKLRIEPGSILDGNLYVHDEIKSGVFRLATRKSGGKESDQIMSTVDIDVKFTNSNMPTMNNVDSSDSTLNHDLQLTEKVFMDDSKLGGDSNHGILPENNVNVNSALETNQTVFQEPDSWKDSSACTLDLCDEKSKEMVTDDQIKTSENKIMLQNDNNFESNNNNNDISMSKNVGRKRRKRKSGDVSYELCNKKSRLMETYINNEFALTEDDDNEKAEAQNDEDDENDEKMKLFPSSDKSVTAILNDSPVKVKSLRNKTISKSEDMSPSRKLLSGRAAHLVGLALTKKEEGKNVRTRDTTSELSEETIEDDVIFSISSEGQAEKLPWIKHIPPDIKASPGKTRLKRKHSDVEETTEVSPSKKSVRFSDPIVTKKLYFQKEIPNEFFQEPKTTYRIVRTKKGKLYVQRNPRDRHIKEEGSETRPVLPSLRDCKFPVSEVIDKLAVSLDLLNSALTSRNISTIGELCSLKEEDIEELPIKAPKIVMFKSVLKKYEENLKHLPNIYGIRRTQGHPATFTGHSASNDIKASLSSMSPVAVLGLLKETMSEADLNVIASGLPSIVTKNEVEDKDISTEDGAHHLEQCLSGTLNTTLEQKEKKKLNNNKLQILFEHSDVPNILKEIREKIVSSNSSTSSGSENVNVNNVNQCFELLRFFCTKSALPEDSVREFYRDFLKQFGLPTVLSELSKCSEMEHESSVFIKQLINYIKKELCSKHETAATVFETLIDGDNFSLAIPPLIIQGGEQTVLENIFSKTSVSFEKVLETVLENIFSKTSMSIEEVLETVAKQFSLKEAKKGILLHIFAKLMRVCAAEDSKCEAVTSFLNAMFKVMDCK